MILLLLLLITHILVQWVDAYSYSSTGAKERFENVFFKKCPKYEFYNRYLAQFNKQGDRDYVVFVFHDPGSSTGGLGDRLAGLLSAFAFSIRTGRTLLVQGDEALETLFRPFTLSDSKHGSYPSSNSHSNRNNSNNIDSNNNDNNISNNLPSWSQWEWAGWQKEFSSNMTYFNKCVNPKSHNTYCALDSNVNRRVLKIRSNRCYLCRWLVRKDLGLSNELLSTLGLDSHSDLYEAAGCMLRLVMWPTSKLWSELDVYLTNQMKGLTRTRGGIEDASSNNNLNSNSNSNSNSNNFNNKTRFPTQIGLHFRCGDNSMMDESNDQVNPECVFRTSESWKGTRFSDDKSVDSPVDLAECASSIAKSSILDVKDGEDVLIYVASDYSKTSDQIIKVLTQNLTGSSRYFILRPPAACHIDLQKTCGSSTILQWFILSLSDKFVVQGLEPVQNSIYHDKPPIISDMTSVDPSSLIMGPISAFSRYASIYSLYSNEIKYGKGCHLASSIKLSKKTHGNWVCDPISFF